MAAKGESTGSKGVAPHRHAQPRGSVSTKPHFHTTLEPWSLKGSFRNFHKIDFSNLPDKGSMEPYRRRVQKQQDDFTNESASSGPRAGKGISVRGTSLHSIFVESLDGEMPIVFDPREFLSRACERTSVMSNTDPQLVLRLESACVTEAALGVLEHVFWVVYLKSFQRKSESLLEQCRAQLTLTWVKFFSNVPMPKEPVVDRFCPILTEALLFIFTEAFPKSKSVVVDRAFAVYVYRCVFRELLGVSLASVTVDRFRSSHVSSPGLSHRDMESPRSMCQPPPSPEFKPFYHRDAYINGDEGAHSIKHLWWDPEEDAIWEDDARKRAIRYRAAVEAGIATNELNYHRASATSAEDTFVTTLVSPAIHTMSHRKALRFANDPGRRVRVGELVRRPLVDLRVQPKRQRPGVSQGTGSSSKEASGGASAKSIGFLGDSSQPGAPLNRSGTSPAALQTANASSKNEASEADMFSRVHRLVLAETYAKKAEARERERFLPPKYMPLELEFEESLKERKKQKAEYEEEKGRKARLLEGRRGAMQAKDIVQVQALQTF